MQSSISQQVSSVVSLSGRHIISNDKQRADSKNAVDKSVVENLSCGSLKKLSPKVNQKCSEVELIKTNQQKQPKLELKQKRERELEDAKWRSHSLKLNIKLMNGAKLIRKNMLKKRALYQRMVGGLIDKEIKDILRDRPINVEKNTSDSLIYSNATDALNNSLNSPLNTSSTNLSSTGQQSSSYKPEKVKSLKLSYPICKPSLFSYKPKKLTDQSISHDLQIEDSSLSELDFDLLNNMDCNDSNNPKNDMNEEEFFRRNNISKDNLIEINVCVEKEKI